MYIRQIATAFGISVLLSACGMLGDTFDGSDDSSSATETEQVTDGWSCESTDSGEWDCYQDDTDKDNTNDSRSSSRSGAGDVQQDSASVDSTPPKKRAALANVATDDLENEDQAAYLQRNYDWQELSSAAYVLQLASHTSREKAAVALSELDVPDAEIVKTWSDEGDRFVVIVGRYADRAAAEQAAKAYLKGNNGATYWIRSTSNLLKAL